MKLLFICIVILAICLMVWFKFIRQDDPMKGVFIMTSDAAAYAAYAAAYYVGLPDLFTPKYDEVV